jgi:hypothetical protein
MKKCAICQNEYKNREKYCSVYCKCLGHYVVNKNNCWVWNGALHSGGTPRVVYRGKVFSAHRILYREYHGAVPKNLTRTCTTTLCISPIHHIRVKKPWMKSLAKKNRVPWYSRMVDTLSNLW